MNLTHTPHATRPPNAHNTSGGVFSNRDLLALILPLVVEQLLVITLGLADIIMVAELGEASVSAVSLGDSINLLIVGLFNALATGGAVVCAHHFGSKQNDMISLTARQLIYATLAVALAITAAGLLFQRELLSFIFGAVEPRVMADANAYFFYSLLSYPLIALYSAAAALFRAQGNSRVSMFASLLVNVLNIGGNAFCIYALKMGVEGVAIPSLIARGVAAILLLSLLSRARPYRGKPAINIKGIHRVKLNPRIIKNILGIGIPNGIENSVFQIGKILVLTLIASFGTSAVAANAAAATLISFNCLPGVAMSLALIPVIGQALGSGNAEEAVRLNRKLILITFAVMAAINIPLIFTVGPQLRLFKLKPRTAELARTMYLIHNISAIVIWPISFVLPASLRAANDAKFTMIASFASMWVMRVGLSYLLARYTALGALSVWYAMIVDWVVRAAAFGLRWKSGKWKAHANFT
ncbi:MAG: MATE family efflux transporter [Spirochaetaceae bacterium]|jgi:putative MATE family efflux protein|nr:MATE family efflux transporter [Spirochaetaceae bacterium]